MRLDHIGVVVKDLEESRKYYEEHFGFDKCSALIDEPEQKVKIIFVKTGTAGSPDIEIIQPAQEDSAVYNFLKKTGGGLHHFAYEVDNLDESVQHFKKMKAVPVGRIYPGAGHSGRRVFWFYTKSRELIELIERQKG